MTKNDTRAATLAVLDNIEDVAAELGLRLAEDRGTLDPVLLAELYSGVWASRERLRRLLARLPGNDGPKAA
jgi:hypothetical protein